MFSNFAGSRVGRGRMNVPNLSAWIDKAFGNTRGSVLIRSANGWILLPPGTATQVITSNGPGADPSYQAAGGGGSGALTLIQKIVTSASQGSATFSGIPSSYTHLMLAIMGRGSQAATSIDIRLQFNGDTGNNYNSQVSVSSGSAADSNAGSTVGASIRIGDISAGNATANYSGCIDVKIQGYAQTTFFKPATGFTSAAVNTTQQNVESGSGVWLSTAAINAIKAFPSAGNWVDGSILSLYGVS